MLTRSLFLATGWFVIAFLGLLLGGRRLQRLNPFLSISWLTLVIALGDVWAILTFGIPREIGILSAIGLLTGILFIVWFKDWNAFGQVLWGMSLLTTALFIAYSFSVTAFTPLSPLSFMLAVVFFFVETIALLLALTHTYESLDATTRRRWRRRIGQLKPVPGYFPKVSLHVPTYNEPAQVVQRTLESLARLDYPNYEVLVIDNNTPDEKVWRSLEMIVKQMGPQFRYLHLDKWPGFKSGALNFGLVQTAPDVEIIGTIDADYQLEPNFLSELTPAFADPKIAFVQTPQDYRDYKGHPFTEATYYGYKYFFEVSMPTRNEHNAIIFAGTMGLIRKSVLQEIGGWDEWCITEDAEASLRILKRGYESIYIKKTYGYGLMPFTFDGLKKQRFRWCFGGIQILRKHWESLMPWSRWADPQNRLSPAQRYFYLIGGLQWYTEIFNLIFAFFLVLGAMFSLLDAGQVIRPLTGPLMVLPAAFLVLNMWRFLWVLRQKLALSWKMAAITMYNFFSLGWVVSLASIQGLFQPQGVFLRTPKAKGQSRVWRALQVTHWETTIGLLCLAAGVGAFLEQPTLQTFVLASLLGWQGSLYLAAPVYSLLSLGAPGEAQPSVVYPARRAVRENWAARWAVALVLAVFVVGAVAQFLPSPSKLPGYALFQPPDVPPERLFGLDPVPVEQRVFTPTPLPTRGLVSTPTSAVTPTLPATSTMMPSPTGTLAPTVTPLLPTATDTPVPPTTTDTPAPPTATVTPSSTSTLPAPPTPTQPPVPTDTPAPSPTLAPVINTTTISVVPTVSP